MSIDRRKRVEGERSTALAGNCQTGCLAGLGTPQTDIGARVSFSVGRLNVDLCVTVQTPPSTTAIRVIAYHTRVSFSPCVPPDMERRVTATKIGRFLTDGES